MSTSSAWENDDLVSKLMFKEITSTTPLTREQEIALFKECRTCSPARKKAIRAVIVNANLRFALKSCLLYKNVPGVNIADMMSEAKIGLLDAFDKYDPDSGIKFISWAVWQIRHRFSKYFDGIDMIRIPTHQKTKLNKARKEGDTDSFDSDTFFFHMITQSPVSLDTPCTDDDTECKLSDVIVDGNAENPEMELYRASVSKTLNDIIDSSLSPDEATVLRNIYGMTSSNGSLAEASDAVNKPHDRVRQMRDRALAKLAKDEKIKECNRILITCTKSSNLR